MAKAILKETPSQPVAVVEADVFDRMNETNDVIEQRAYELYQSRGGKHGADQDDWFAAETEILKSPHVSRNITPVQVSLTVPVSNFVADDLEVSVGHRRAVICGIHRSSGSSPDGMPYRRTRVMQIIELPYDVDPKRTAASLRDGVLHVVLPRLIETAANRLETN